MDWAGVKAGGKKNNNTKTKQLFIFAMPKLRAKRKAKLCRKKETCPEKC